MKGWWIHLIIIDLYFHQTTFIHLNIYMNLDTHMLHTHMLRYTLNLLCHINFLHTPPWSIKLEGATEFCKLLKVSGAIRSIYPFRNPIIYGFIRRCPEATLYMDCSRRVECGYESRLENSWGSLLANSSHTTVPVR